MSHPLITVAVGAHYPLDQRALAALITELPGLRVIPLVDPVVSRTIVLLSRSRAHLTPAAQALYDLVRRQAA